VYAEARWLCRVVFVGHFGGKGRFLCQNPLNQTAIIYMGILVSNRPCSQVADAGEGFIYRIMAAVLISRRDEYIAYLVNVVQLS